MDKLFFAMYLDILSSATFLGWSLRVGVFLVEDDTLSQFGSDDCTSGQVLSLALNMELENDDGVKEHLTYLDDQRDEMQFIIIAFRLGLGLGGFGSLHICITLTIPIETALHLLQIVRPGDWTGSIVRLDITSGSILRGSGGGGGLCSWHLDKVLSGKVLCYRRFFT